MLFDFLFCTEEEFEIVFERIAEKEDFIIAECKYDHDYDDGIVS